MKIASKNTVDQKAAAAFVEKHRLFFHAETWLGCYDEQLQQLFIVNNNHEITGCFLLYVYKKAFLKFIIAPPYTPGIALFIVNPAQTQVKRQTHIKEVMALIAGYVDGLKGHVVDIQLGDEFTDAQPFIWRGFKVSPRFTYHLRLHPDKEVLWQALASEKRKSISKAEKDGLFVDPNVSAETVISLVKASLEKGGVLANQLLLTRLISMLVHHSDAICKQTVWEGKVVAVSIAVLDQNRCIYLFGGYTADNAHHGAGVTCMWQTILEAKIKAYAFFDFEGSMNPGIERYYREFGGQMISAHQIRKIALWLTAFKRFR